MWQQDSKGWTGRGGGGVAAQVQVPRCCLWQLWDFAFQPRRGPSSETYQRQLETVSVTKGCPWVTYDVLLCASVWCVCGCVCGWCVVCPLTCQQARLQYVSLHLTLVILFVFDSIITLFKMAFQPLSPEGGDSLPTPTHTHTETRNWFDCRDSRTVGQGGRKRRTHIYEAHKNYWHIRSHKYLRIQYSTYTYTYIHKIPIIKDENPPSKNESKVSSKVKAKIALDAIKLRAFERQRARKCNLILIGLGLKANKAEKSLREWEESF